MQRITIEIPDDVFDAFNKSAKQMGEKFAETMGDFVSSNPYFSDVRQTMCDNAVSLDEWKKERGFGISGKGISRSIRRRNTPK